MAGLLSSYLRKTVKTLCVSNTDRSFCLALTWIAAQHGPMKRLVKGRDWSCLLQTKELGRSLMVETSTGTQAVSRRIRLQSCRHRNRSQGQLLREPETRSSKYGRTGIVLLLKNSQRHVREKNGLKSRNREILRE